MSVKIIHVSDTHLRKFNPEAGNILIHSGDALNRGSISELSTFKKQLKRIKKNYDHIIFVPGNHDRIFEQSPIFAAEYLEEGIDNLKVLNHQRTVIDGLVFFGTPYQPEFCNWAFNLPPHELLEKFSQIHKDTDVLITHCPVRGILDRTIQNENVGSSELSANMPSKLKLHAFGHIHWSKGLVKLGDTWYSNGAICDEQYLPFNKENVIEL